MTIFVMSDTECTAPDSEINLPGVVQTFYGHQEGRQVHSHLSDTYPRK